MIKNKEQLNAYIKADRIMNIGSEYSFIQKLKGLFFPNYILRFLKRYRIAEFYSTKNGSTAKIVFLWNKYWCDRLMLKLGFSIAYNVFGWGLCIPHYGTIVVGSGNKIGNCAVIHTSTCITKGKKVIGDGFYLSTGSIISDDVHMGDNVSVAAHSLVNKKCQFVSNVLIGGCPAQKLKETEPWYIRDGAEYGRRVKECKKIKGIEQ